MPKDDLATVLKAAASLTVAGLGLWGGRYMVSMPTPAGWPLATYMKDCLRPVPCCAAQQPECLSNLYAIGIPLQLLHTFQSHSIGLVFTQSST